MGEIRIDIKNVAGIPGTGHLYFVYRPAADAPTIVKGEALDG